jgi:MFS family permease
VTGAPAPWESGWRARVPALQHRDFRILWLGMFFSSATMMFQFYAQGWFILGLTSSAALLGVVGVTRGTGMLIFGLYGGALADRMDRRLLLIVTQSAALVTYAVLAALIIADRIALWPAFALIFVAASVESVDAPARQALLPHLVPREHLPNAVALFIAAQVSSYAFLPPLAGVAIDLVGSGGAFAASLLGHAVVVGALVIMKTRAQVEPRPERVTTSVVRGIAYAGSSPGVLWVLLFGFFVGILGFPIISTLAPFWMQHELGLGPVGWTLMGWIWGLGTLVSTVYLSTHDVSNRVGRVVLVSAAGFALTLVVFGLTRALPLAAAMWCLNGTFFTANMISSTALLQVLVANAYMGRVMSLRLVSSALNQVAAAPLGAIGDAFGMGRMVPGTAALLAALVIFIPLIRRDARDLRPPRPAIEADAPAL